MSIHFSSATPECSTPQDLFDALNAEFKFTLDPCATKKNAKCKKFYTKRDNGLLPSWAGETVFMNPPYGNARHPCKKNCKKKKCKERNYHTKKYVAGINEWMQKAAHAAQVGNAIVVCLVPVRTDTEWWSAIYDHKTHAPRPWTKEIRFLKGRLKFGGAKNSAPFPSAIIVLGPPHQK